jgi:hypothetical protein
MASTHVEPHLEPCMQQMKYRNYFTAADEIAVTTQLFSLHKDAISRSESAVSSGTYTE